MPRATNRANKIYDVAAFFASECLLADGSFFWQGRNVWTLENLERLWQVFILNPDTSDKSFIAKWSEQLSGSSDDVYRLATEAAAVYSLFPYYKQMGPVSKKKLIEEVRTMGPDIGQFDAHRWSMFEQALDEHGIARAGTDYLTGRPFHIGFYLAFALEIKRRGLTSLEEIDPVILVDTVLTWSSQDMGFRANGSRNAVLNLFWPEDFEPTASNDHKQRMAKNLSARFDLKPLKNVDETILQARRYMESNGFENNFDMYDDERVRRLWDIKPENKKRRATPGPPGTKISETDKTSADPESVVDATTPTITDLAEQTFLQESFLRDIESLLESKKQLIFEGPPGSGKTYVAEQFARYFTGQSLTATKTNDQVELIQFHQSYSYEDFVEGIRPRMDGGQLVYHVEAGIFLRLVGRAAENPDKRYVLIIDEINRGNVSRILGELMLLLEYRDKSATLPYSKDPLQIPENLYIIGTMNTADRSLSQIDYALRRRFYFVRFMSIENGAAPVLDGWLTRKNLDATTHANILQVFIALNQQLETDLGTDDLQVGHSYFMDDNIHSERQQQHIWTYAVLPLIREYLYHHRERESLLDHYRWDRLTRMVTPTVEEQIPTDSLETDAFNEFEQ